MKEFQYLAFVALYCSIVSLSDLSLGWADTHTPYRALRGGLFSTSLLYPSASSRSDKIHGTASSSSSQDPIKMSASGHLTAATTTATITLTPNPDRASPHLPSPYLYLRSSISHRQRIIAAKWLLRAKVSCITPHALARPFPANGVSRLAQGSPPHHTSKWHDR